VRTLLTLALAAAVAAAAPDEKRIRTALAAILSTPKEKERAALIEALGEGDLDEIEEAVRKGPLLARDAAEARGRENLVKAGGGVGGYTFEHDGETYGYAVHVPGGYDADKGAALLLDPGHGILAKSDQKEKVESLAFFRNCADDAGGRDWLVVRTEIVEKIGPEARSLPEETGNRIFQLLFRDLATRYHFDPDRVYVSGLSQTGFWAWTLGCYRADRFAGIAPMGAVTWEVNHRHANLLALPVFVLHGAKDGTCPVNQPRQTCAELARIGVRVRYKELPGGHDGSVWSAMPTALRWLQERPRDRYPKRVSKSLQTVQDGWCYWLRVDRLEDEQGGRAGDAPKAGIDGEIDGQVIRLFSTGVAQATVCLASEMMDLKKPVTVVWNGRNVFEGVAPRSLATMLALVYDKTDWKATFEAALELKAP
jgi:dienelactone hydrolase